MDAEWPFTRRGMRQAVQAFSIAYRLHPGCLLRLRDYPGALVRLLVLEFALFLDGQLRLFLLLSFSFVLFSYIAHLDLSCMAILPLILL